MPFPWYQPDVPPPAPEKARAMYEAELRDRAMLLLRLGYTAAETKLRLRGNVHWDFELHGAPPHLKRVDAIVDQVFATRRAGVGGPPSVEG
jgi:hypothetical protein